MGKKRKKEKKEAATGNEIAVKLPSVPNFPYVPKDVEPPKGVVLLLECEGGYVLGEWDGVYFFDSGATKIEAQYGDVLFWCVVLDSNGEAIFTEQ